MLKHFSALTIALSLISAHAAAQDANAIAKVQDNQSCPGCNLFQADLAYQDSEKLNLAGARLRQADLSLSTYDDVNLTKANMSVTNLFGARFNRSNFSQANLQKAVAVGTYFGASNLSGADLSGANLSGADLSIAKGLTQDQLNRACGDSSTKLPSGKTIPSCS